MDTKSLQYFVAVAEAGSFNNASKILGIAQPPLSKQIQNLENRLGVQLFYRTKQGVSLTEEGNLLLKRAKELLYFMNQTKVEVQTVGKEPAGVLNVACIESYCNPFLVNVIDSFQKKYPMVNYQLAMGNTKNVLKRINESEAELGIIRDYDWNQEESSFEKVKLFRTSWVAVMHKDHPLAQRKETALSLMNLMPYDLIVPRNHYIVSQLNSVMLPLYHSLKFKYQFESFVVGLELINRSMGVGLMPDTLSSNPYYKNLMAKKIVELDDQFLESEVTIIYRKSLPLSKVARLFIEEARDFANNVDMIK